MYNYLGTPIAYRRILAAAGRSPLRALALARRLVRRRPKDPWAQTSLAAALLASERPAEARAPLELARASFVRRGCTPGALRCEYGLLQIDRLVFARPNIDADLGDLADRIAASGDELLAALVRLDQAHQLNVRGAPRAAAELLGQIAPALRARGPVMLARLRRIEAVAVFRQGRSAEAVAILRDAERVFLRRRLWIDVARCWFELSAAIKREDLDASRAFSALAEAMAAQADLPFLTARCRKRGGATAASQGLYDLSLQQTMAARDGFRSMGRLSDVATCLLHIGNVYYYTGHWAAASVAYLRAEAQFVAIGNIGNWTIARRARAKAYRRMGRAEAARGLLFDVERAAAEHGYSEELAEVWSEQAALLALAGRPAEADARYAQAHELFAQLGSRVAAAGCRLDQGWLAVEAGDIARAEAHFAAAGAIQNKPNHTWQLAHGLGRCAEARGDGRSALGHYLAASDTLAALRSQIADERTSSQLFAYAARLHADALRLAAELGDPASALRLTEGQRALALRRLMAGDPAPGPAAFVSLSAQLASLLDQPDADEVALDAALDAYGAAVLRARPADSAPSIIDRLIPSRPIDLDDTRRTLRAALGPGWTALVYSVVGERLHIICLSDEGVDLTVLTKGADLRQLIRQASLADYRYYTYNDAPLAQGGAARPWEGPRRLAEALLPPHVLRRLAPDRRLLIVPAGSLHGLPWAALRLDDGWLAERATVQVLPALSAAPQLAGRRPEGRRALLVGCSDFGERAAALPEVAAELDRVGAIWPGPQRRLLDGAASCGALLAALAEPGLAVLHLATHAQLLPHQGRAAHLKLWDDDLRLNAVAGMRLGGATVVLSACDGAAADVLPGEEVLSLSWALLAAGAAGVVSCLWPMADGAELPLIEALYAAILGGDDLAAALARAQRAAITAGVAPPIWGGLLAFGGLGAPITT